MRVNFLEFDNKYVAQVYINKEEITNAEIVQKIEQLKKECNKIAIYVNGFKNIRNSMKEILKK